MKFLAFLILLIIISCKPEFSLTEQTQLSGHWDGEMTKEGKSWKASLDISFIKNEIHVYAHLPDYGMRYHTIKNINKDDNILILSSGSGRREVIFKARLKDETLNGEFSGFGFNANLLLKRTDRVAKTVLTEDIKFTSNSLNLYGTLYKPKGVSNFPVIVFVHSSGKQLRTDQHNINIAMALIDMGIGSFLYDRQGKGDSEGVNDRNLDFELQANDAINAARMLNYRKDISKIGIYGLSQGGWTAPLAVSKSNLFSFMIVVSASGINPYEQDLFVNENRLLNLTLSSEEKKSLQNYIHLSKTTDPKQMISNWVGDYQKNLKFFLYDVTSDWKKISIPVLAIWGKKDDIVPAIKSESIISSNFKNKSLLTTHIIDNANHSLWIIPKSGEWDFPRRAPKYEIVIKEWVSKIVL